MLLGFQRMKAMAKHRSHSIEFKRQVAQEFIAGETLHSLARRHDVSRNDQPVNGCPSDGCGVESCYPSPPTTERLHSPLGPRLARRIQTVVATRTVCPHGSNSSSTSAGVFQPKVFLGRAFRAAATAVISSALWMLRSVPFGKY